MENFQDGCFINGKHVSQLVPTEYVAGIGIKTTKSFNIDSKTGKMTEEITTIDGDGLVPLYSATAGVDRNAANVHIMQDRNHMYLLLESQGVSDTLNDIMVRFDSGIAGKM